MQVVAPLVLVELQGVVADDGVPTRGAVGAGAGGYAEALGVGEVVGQVGKAQHKGGVIPVEPQVLQHRTVSQETGGEITRPDGDARDLGAVLKRTEGLNGTGHQSQPHSGECR
ncbi:MAG: hypothetical protein AcusKO_31140 [Acuticoccus sp.]